MNEAAGATDKKKAILVISSHVVRGTVGNRAVALALEALGHPTWVLPTVTLPWHLGHGPGTMIIADENEFTSLCHDLANAPWKHEIAGIISGFMASPSQVVTTAALVTGLKAENSELVYLCDPVIGDFTSESIGDNMVAGYGNEGRLYVSEEIATAIQEKLLPLADITTPNMFELGWLNALNPQEPAKNQAQMLAQARSLNVANVLVTSVPGLMRGCVGSVLVESDKAIMSEHKALANPPNGLGDLTSALFLSNRLGGLSTAKTLEKTTASVFEVLARTTRAGADELALEGNIASLSRPMAMVNMRQLK
jgi:pyridoxine kinase